MSLKSTILATPPPPDANVQMREAAEKQDAVSWFNHPTTRRLMASLTEDRNALLAQAESQSLSVAQHPQLSVTLQRAHTLKMVQQKINQLGQQTTT